MNIYEHAKFKEKLEKLPTEYSVTKDKSIKIRTKYLSDVYIGDKRYTTSIFYVDINTVFMSLIELRLFLSKNWKYVDMVFTWNMVTDEMFCLKRKLLHNINDYAYEKNDKFKQTQKRSYFFNGKEISEPIFKKMKLNKKLKKIKNQN